MNFLADMKLANKLVLSFVGAAAISFIISLFGYYQLNRIGDAGEELYDQVTVPLGQLAQISVDFQRERINLRDALGAPDAAGRAEAAQTLESLQEQLDKAARTVESTLVTEKARAEFREFMAANNAYHTIVDRILALNKAGKHEEADALMQGEAKRLALREQDLINRLLDNKLQEAHETSTQNHDTAVSASNIMVAVAFGSAIVSVLLGIFIARTISRPVAELAEDAHRIAQGDLTIVINSVRKDEVGHLASSFRAMTESLRNTIGQVAQSSNSLSASSEQLHTSSAQIATGAEEMLAQTQNVATASEEMAATAQEIAASCQRAAESARHVADSATEGVKVVDHTVEVMNRIATRVKGTAGNVVQLGERSHQIGDIVGTIENIAAQTNLLALNAAIEAARAGEMGRGFAVVADEVRTLAARTTQATHEISDMIRTIQTETKNAVTAMEESVSEVEVGTSEASRSGESLRNIFEQINHLHTQITQVATAAEQQTSVTGEISHNIHQVTSVVDQTAQNAQESALSAAQLSENATELRKLVQQFRT